MAEAAQENGAYVSVFDHKGSHYLQVLKNCHRFLRPKVYFEIGVDKGDTVILSDCTTVAVDPKLEIDRNIIGNKNALLLFQETSDEFFQRRNIPQLLGQPFDLAFLDGLHHSEVLLRDFLNTEKNARKDSVIILHDCLPTDIYMTRRDQFDAEIRSKTPTPAAWTGDVWKTLRIIRKYRRDLLIVCVDSPPTGLVFITNLDPGSKILREKYFDVQNEMQAMTLTHKGLTEFLAENSVLSTSKIDEEQKIRRILAD